MHLAADAAGLHPDQGAEIAGLLVEGEHPDQAGDRLDLGQLRPLPQG